MTKMEEVKKVVDLRFQNLREDIESRVAETITRKKGEYGARGTSSSGVAMKEYKDTDVAAARELAEAMLNQYQTVLFDFGYRIEGDEDVDFVLNEIKILLEEWKQKTLYGVEKSCHGAGFKDQNLVSHLSGQVVEEVKAISERIQRSLRAEAATTSRQQKKEEQEAVETAERIALTPAFMDPLDIQRVRSERVRDLLKELNVNFKNNCPHAAAALIRAVAIVAIRQYFIEQGKKDELRKYAPDVLDQFSNLQELPSTVREAARHLKGNAKILADLALHSDEIVITIADVAHSQASLKAVVQWTAAQKPVFSSL